MKDNPESLDPREMKVLADILALVLQDQPGQSAVALEAIRRRARQNRMTGGALKNLFQIMAERAAAEAGAPEPPDLPDHPAGMRSSIIRLRAANSNLENALAAANAEAGRLRADIDQVQARLMGVQERSRELAESARSGRKQAGLIGAAIATCVVVVSGVVLEQVLTPSPPAVATITAPPRFLPPPEPPPLPPRRPTAEPARPSAPAAGSAASTGRTALSIENDPELQETLQRLSRGAPIEAPAEPDAAVAPPPAAAAPPPAEPAPPTGPAAAVPAPPSATGEPLTVQVHDAVVAHVKACWAANMHRLADVHFRARLRVVTDETGVIRQVKLAQEDVPRLTDPAYQAFAQAAIHSVLDPQCAQLPIPPTMQGHKFAFDFTFVP